MHSIQRRCQRGVGRHTPAPIRIRTQRVAAARTYGRTALPLFFHITLVPWRFHGEKRSRLPFVVVTHLFCRPSDILAYPSVLPFPPHWLGWRDVGGKHGQRQRACCRRGRPQRGKRRRKKKQRPRRAVEKSLAGCLTGRRGLPAVIGKVWRKAEGSPAFHRLSGRRPGGASRACRTTKREKMVCFALLLLHRKAGRAGREARWGRIAMRQEVVGPPGRNGIRRKIGLWCLRGGEKKKRRRRSRRRGTTWQRRRRRGGKKRRRIQLLYSSTIAVVHRGCLLPPPVGPPWAAAAAAAVVVVVGGGEKKGMLPEPRSPGRRWL